MRVELGGRGAGTAVDAAAQPAPGVKRKEGSGVGKRRDAALRSFFQALLKKSHKLFA